MQFMTFGSIHIGTYHVTLEIFEISKKNGIQSIDTIKRRMELGTETYRYKKLSTAMVDDLCDVLTDFVNIMNGYKVAGYKAIATSAIREAENDLLVLGRIKQLTGLHVEILSNSEQRFLSYKAIATIENRFPEFIQKGTAIVDVDGGSTQVSLFDKEKLVTTQNMKIGNLRIRDRLQSLARETIHYDRLIEELIQNEIQSFKKMYLKDRAIENVILHGDFLTEIIFPNIDDKASRVMTREEFEIWYKKLIGKSPAELAMAIGVPMEFASLVLPSVIIYHSFIHEMNASMIWMPGTHLARGVAYEFAVRQKMLKPVHDFEGDITAAARHISKRYAVNRAHTQNMDMTAVAMFDATKKIHGMKERERLLLRIAVMLHDVGKYISMNNVADTSYSIIMSNEIIGLSHKEREMIALIARYNTEEFPDYETLALKSTITSGDYLKLAGLTAIVRLANVYDRSHMQKIQTITAVLKNQNLVLNLGISEDFVLEQRMAVEKEEFFTEVFGVRPVLRLKKV